MASKHDEKEKTEVVVPRTAADVQRLKLDKLMKNAAAGKQIHIADRPDDKLPRVFNPPEFIRNIWGSSAGAGSGDFHVYRGIRRREYARQKFMNEQSKMEEKDKAYIQKVEQNKLEAEERTAKKRKKRQKKQTKQRMKKFKEAQKKRAGGEKRAESESESSEAEQGDDEEVGKDQDDNNDRNGDHKEEDETEGNKEKEKKTVTHWPNHWPTSVL